MHLRALILTVFLTGVVQGVAFLLFSLSCSVLSHAQLYRIRHWCIIPTDNEFLVVSPGQFFGQTIFFSALVLVVIVLWLVLAILTLCLRRGKL
jgi:uncharacterized membrane protein